MIQIPKWKIYTAFVVCFLGIIYAAPNIIHKDFLEKLPGWWPKQTINLGLDLQGGSHLVLEVDLKAGMKDRMHAMVGDVRSALRKAHVKYTGLTSHEGEIHLKLIDKDEDSLRTAIHNMDPTLQIKTEGDATILFYPSEVLAKKAHDVVRQSREIVERRINEFGLAEPNIQIQGNDRILVQLPGIQNPERIKALLGKTAKMSFHLVHEGGNTPVGGVIKLPVRDRTDSGGHDTLTLEKLPLLGGENLVDAQPRVGENNAPEIIFKLDTVGSRKFAEITRDNVGRRLAIVLDNQILMAPGIRGVIPSGSGEITGSFTMQQVQDLALLMRAGALPAPLVPIEERTVGPDLGADSISQGKLATVTSIIFVALFMLLAYAAFGVIADIALIFNLILLFGAMSMLGATLTLSGIAGIALTIGMAVDANILIYERIKEELRLGRRISVAIDAGYERAMATIIDSNLTTLIGAAVLFYFGSGPVRGFAVTLSLGIIISMFTAISLTRIAVSWFINFRKPQDISI